MTVNITPQSSNKKDDRMRILLITGRDEDYRQLRIWLDQELGNNFILNREATYEAGWAEIAKFNHDVCVIDYHLGDPNGVDLVTDGDSIAYPAKMLLLVDSEIEGLRAQAKAAGAADVFEKPMLTAQFFALALQNYAQQRQTVPVIQANAPKKARDSREIVCYTDNEVITEVEGKWESLTGYSNDDIIGRKLQSLIHPNDQKGFEIAIRPVQSGNLQSHRIELRLQTMEGDSRWAECVVSSALDATGGVAGLEANFYDIQDRKRIEAEQDRRLDEMASAIRAKSDFLASMSHELRTPLNAILGKTELLSEGYEGTLNPRQQSSLRAIQASGEHLLSLINDTLDLSRIEAGDIPLHIEPLMVDALLQSSLHQVQDMARRKMITIRKRLGHPALHVHADERRLRQIMINLLSNAVKFTPEGGTIIVEAEGDIAQSKIFFKVWDTGIGIAKEDMKGLFQRFMQIDTQLTRSESGSGLGLALVKHLTELHQGAVSVESKVDEGSCFTITLPWKPGKAADASSIIEDDSNSGSAEDILITDTGQLQAAAQARANALALNEDEMAEIAAEMAEIERQLAHGMQKVNGPAPRTLPPASVPMQPPTLIPPKPAAPDGSVQPLDGWQHAEQMPPIEGSSLDARSVPSNFPIDLSPEPSNASNVDIPVENANPAPNAPLILIAEDNEMNYIMLSDYLQVKGFRVAIANDGLEAIDMVKRVNPDLVLMDLQMPEMDGLEAIERLRQTISQEQLPIIGLTALAMPGDKERCIAAGANDYMSKPVVLRELVANIERMLAKQMVR